MYTILEAATTITPTSTFFNALLAAIPPSILTAFITYFMFRKQNIKVDKEKSYKLLVDNIFIPFHYKLERHLYHEITTLPDFQNWELYVKHYEISINYLFSHKKWFKLIYTMLSDFTLTKSKVEINYIYHSFKELDGMIKGKKLEYYLSDDFLKHFKNVLEYLEEIDFSKATESELRVLNYRFRDFSKSYFRELQNSRKALGLKNRSSLYRDTFNIYNNFVLFYMKQFWWIFTCLLIELILLVVLLVLKFKN